MPPSQLARCTNNIPKPKARWRPTPRASKWAKAVELLDVQLNAFARSHIVRRTQASASQARKGQTIDGPDATLTGRLRVTDPTAFAHLLARGVGRHRAFGFGMLLLQRAS